MIVRLPECRDSFDVEEVIREASVAEKISLLAGRDFWHTTPLPRFNVPSIRLSDGPNGVRGTKFFNGVSAACLPCGTGLAATWDRPLLHKAGALIGEECKAKGAHCWLGPTVCIQRSPLAGRGFESLSEDPWLTGKLAASYINGVQATGVISTIKHWFANDQEHERVGVNVMVNDRAMREIHMLPFQIAIRESCPGAVMACYNKVNGTHVSESKLLLDGMLRDDWGWNGVVMSDWFGTYSTTEALNAGLDLEMPGPARLRGPLADLAVSTRKVTRATIDARARNMLHFIKAASQIDVADEEGMRNFEEDQQLNRTLAADSVVLLKNEDRTLPLRQQIRKIALIGPNMKNTAFCGGGSASLQPYYTVSPFEGILSNLAPETKVDFQVGAEAYGYLPALDTTNATTPDGVPGLRMQFYKDAPYISCRKPVESIIIPNSSWQLMGFTHPLLERLFYADVEACFVAPETAEYEVGIVAYGSISLYIDGKLVIDNATKQKSGNFFFGKGTREEKAVVKLEQGKKYHIKIEFGSAPTSKLIKPGVVNFGGGAGRMGLVRKVDEELAIANAVAAAKKADLTVLCVGLSSDWESEGFDRKDMHLPGALDRLINAVLDADPSTVVITQSGTPFDMSSWAGRARTHVHAWYGGNETGNGIADVLFGRVNPSGKLPLTFPRRVEDTPTYLNFGSERGRVVYGEGIYVGYRYYEKVNRDVLYPFGHGLSYTTFEYSDLRVSTSSAALCVSNRGMVAGAETVQLYISADKNTSSIARPEKELKGFEKIFLQPGESRYVEIEFDKHAVAFWDEVLQAWVCEEGKYQAHVGASSQDIRLTGNFTIDRTTIWTGA